MVSNASFSAEDASRLLFLKRLAPLSAQVRPALSAAPAADDEAQALPRVPGRVEEPLPSCEGR